MCGIVAVLPVADGRAAPDVEALASLVRDAAALVAAFRPGVSDCEQLEAARAACDQAVAELAGFAGLAALAANSAPLEKAASELSAGVALLERAVESAGGSLATALIEQLNAHLTGILDAAFALQHDRLGNLAPVAALAQGSAQRDHLRAAYSINVTLNALDRLEVRGRDSAGLHLFVRCRPDALPAPLATEAERRAAADDFTNLALRALPDHDGRAIYSFVYKVAAEVGELGDNVRQLRADITADLLLAHLLETPGVSAEVLAHTRWASVGLTSQANAHPLNQEQTSAEPSGYFVGALNGDVDNYQSIVAEEGFQFSDAITTDAKVIPTLVAHLASTGLNGVDAFRAAVARFDGSVAIAAAGATEPGRIFLALRGSGQALYVGLASDSLIVASEAYGLVEETSRYLRLEGETAASDGSLGQIVVLDASKGARVAALGRLSYGGAVLAVSESDLKRAEVRTRDLDRRGHKHFLSKEIHEAPKSFMKTLRGRIASRDGQLTVTLGEEILPQRVRDVLCRGEVARIRVIGQGTAAVAGQGVAAAIAEALKGSVIVVDALPASELSGFQLCADMRDTLIVAISQSGTTTDTNRTVDLARARGAAVIAIVNRRGSHLTERADGVLYTSDGRDVELSVASTKAFYSQIAAGLLLGEALAVAAGAGDSDRRQRLLAALIDLPTQMEVVLSREPEVAAAARKHAPRRRNWALVGNGRNRVAASEIRIKLSELSYKSIACDTTEDKKHIDLSSEPLVLVAAAGLAGATASDVAKEIEIFRAHKACPIVIASDDGPAFSAAREVLRVPAVDEELAFVLATMVGHLFGYHAAQAIDALARPLREARIALEEARLSAARGDARKLLRHQLAEPAQRFSRDLAAGRYDAILEARTGAALTLAFRYATGVLPLDYFVSDFGRPGSPRAVTEELGRALTEGIEQLTRPIDAIKHQAKTVTVGISRTEAPVVVTPLLQAILSAGVGRELIAYHDLETVTALDAAVSEVTGHTRYAVEAVGERLHARVVAQSGSSAGLRSRLADNPVLTGAKNIVAHERRLMVAIGGRDGRMVIMLPENSAGACTGLLLLHVRLHDGVSAAVARRVLSSYRNRYNLLRDHLAERGDTLDDGELAKLPPTELLTKPIEALADVLCP